MNELSVFYTMVKRWVVIRDGVELAKEQSHALWRMFSSYIESYPDALEVFARAHGFVEVVYKQRRNCEILIAKSLASISVPPPSSQRRLLAKLAKGTVEPKAPKVSRSQARLKAS